MTIQEIRGDQLKETDRIVLIDEMGIPRYFKPRRQKGAKGREINYSIGVGQDTHRSPLASWFIGSPVPTSGNRNGDSGTGRWYKDAGDYVYVEREPEKTVEEKLAILTIGLRADAANPQSAQLLAQIGEN